MTWTTGLRERILIYGWNLPFKVDSFKYYEYVLCYVDNIVCISHVPLNKIDGMKDVFKMKGDEAEPLEIYLGAILKKVTNDDGIEC